MKNKIVNIHLILRIKILLRHIRELEQLSRIHFWHVFSNHTARLTAINDRKEGTYGYLSHPIRHSAYPSHRLSDGVAIQAA